MQPAMAFPEDYGFPEDLMMAPAPADLNFMNMIKEEINSPNEDQPDASAFNAAPHRPPNPMDFEATAPVPEAKKGRKRAAESSAATVKPSEGEQKKKASGVVGLTELIDKIAAEKSSLRFDDETKLYEVLDGPAFEARFQELRRTRSKKSNETASRPFSRMHVHYTIVRGERWAGTGTAFRAKDAVVDDFLDTEKIQANKVNVTLMPSDGLAGFQITLQHFLNVTGAGDAFKRAMRAKEGEDSSPHSDQTSSPDAAAPAPEVLPPPPQREGSDDYWHTLSIDSVSDAVNAVWSENSKGDQAYFFFRADEAKAAPFPNGAIVKLVDGKLHADDAPAQHAVFLVVSDLNAKWKGDPAPSPAEEHLGHWCCFLGQVPVRVKGRVPAGAYVGPACDGSGRGVVVATPGAAPVVGIALVGKDGDGDGVVRAMSFAGLNAIKGGVGAGLTGLLEEGLRGTGREVAALRDDLSRTQEAVGATMATLHARVGHMERRLEESGVATATVTVAVAGSGVVGPEQLASPRKEGGRRKMQLPGTGVVGGKEVELRIMGCSADDADEAGVPLYPGSAEGFFAGKVAGKWDEELFRAQSVGSPKGWCGGLDEQRKTRLLILSALCVLFVGVVVAAFFVGWQSANDFAAGDDPMAPAPAGPAEEQEKAAVNCQAMTTMIECGGAAACVWAEVESGEFAGLFACVDAAGGGDAWETPHVPEEDADTPADTPQQTPQQTPSEGGGGGEEGDGGGDGESRGESFDDDKEVGASDDAGAPVSCADMATAAACGAAADCEWGDVTGSGVAACVSSDVAEAARCGAHQSEAACEGGVMCAWDGEASACGVERTGMLLPDCVQVAEEADCQVATGCEWRARDGPDGDGAEFGCEALPTCQQMTAAVECEAVRGCVWVRLGETRDVCMVDPAAEGEGGGGGEPSMDVKP